MPPRPLSMSGSKKLLLYADGGWGKTRFLGGSQGKVLIIRPPVDHVDSILGADRKRCEEWVANNWSDMEDIFEESRLGGKQRDWVWFDSISAYQDIGLDDLWDTIITENPKRKRYGLDKGDYNINMQRLGRWVRDMVTLSDQGLFNFGITAWPADPAQHGSMQVSEDEEVPSKLMPWVQGKNMAQKVCGYMNMVAFGEFTEKGSRVIRLQASDRYYAKDQFDAFVESNHSLVNPTMSKLEAAVDIARGSSNGKKATPTVRRVVRKTKKVTR